MIERTTAPFPYTGGKRRIASQVWDRLGDVPNYVEPFAGSLAVLLARPTVPNYETVNDLDGMIVNVWRSLKQHPEETARWAEGPSTEIDLVARQRLLLSRKSDLQANLMSDPNSCEPMLAGWWIWGCCSWVGTNWCGTFANKRPAVNRRGIFRLDVRDDLEGYFRELSNRLRHVRMFAGDFERVLTPAVTYKIGTTGVLLDPPYGPASGRSPELYAAEDSTASVRAFEWAIANGDNPRLRIAFCEYDGVFDFPESWQCVSWKTDGGLAKTGDGPGRTNAKRERIWLSPHCLEVEAEADAA